MGIYMEEMTSEEKRKEMMKNNHVKDRKGSESRRRRSKAKQEGKGEKGLYPNQNAQMGHGLLARSDVQVP